MKKFFFPILVILSCYHFLSATTPSIALDEDGCLTCHRYPGLVSRGEGKNRLKVLHVDEEGFSASKHGKLGCRRCHKDVVKVPHTGQTTVDCTTECHLTQKDKNLVRDYPLAGFHKDEQSFIIRLEDESSCRVCHSLYPHSENSMVRALLNMHTGFAFCEVCHLKREKPGDLTFGWEDTENVKFHGKPFGSRYNPRTGKAHKTEDFLSRIGVFENEKGSRRLLVHIADAEKAKKSVLQGKTAKPGEKEFVYFHRDIKKKEISLACNECHSPKSILDFRGLGFDARKTRYLIELDIKGMVTKYESFYLPRLFGGD